MRLTTAILPFALGCFAAPLASQSPALTPPPEGAMCFGFAFGKWTPPLDWKVAGHITAPDTAHMAHAPNGRSWAVDASDVGADSTLMLFPPWWPVGVIIRFDRKLAVPGDTVAGSAYAMVADGTKSPPRSSIRAWLKPCGAPDK